MIRGLRDGTDLDFEMQIAGMNETMAPDVQRFSFQPRWPSAPSPPHWSANRVHGRRRLGVRAASVAASLKAKFAG